MKEGANHSRPFLSFMIIRPSFATVVIRLV